MTEQRYQDDAKRLIKGYGQEIPLYEQVVKLSQRQFDLMSKGEREGVPELMQEKGRLIEQIRQIESEIGDAKDRWEEMEAQLDPGLRQEVVQLVKRIRELIEKTLEKDSENEILFKQWAQDLAGQMRNARQSRTATRAYESQAKGGGRQDSILFDKKE